MKPQILPSEWNRSPRCHDRPSALVAWTAQSRSHIPEKVSGLESLSLRNSVWVAEKPGCPPLRIAGNCGNLDYSCLNRTRKMCLAGPRRHGLRPFYLELRCYVRDNETPSGECDAITNPSFGECESTPVP